MTLYFKDELVKQAEQLIKIHSSKDKVKTLNYLNDIHNILNSFNTTGMFNINYAQILDKKIRNDYPYCDELDTYNSQQRISHTNMKQNIVVVPEEIRRLRVDWYGILYTELYNEGIVNCIEDFLKES